MALTADMLAVVVVVEKSLGRVVIEVVVVVGRVVRLKRAGLDVVVLSEVDIALERGVALVNAFMTMFVRAFVA